MMYRTITLTLIVLCLHFTVSAQNNASQDREKPSSQTPLVGTGGPEGSPIGLYTIYDGSTLRRGDFTFRIAYSNYDRYPGNIDIVDVPLSFNVGINDHIELLFKTNGRPGSKVNDTQHLSTFGLPDLQLFCGAALCNGPSVAPLPRLVGSNDKVGLGSAPTYHWYRERDDITQPDPFTPLLRAYEDNLGVNRSFNQMQRGAGPRGYITEAGPIMFVDGPLPNMFANSFIPNPTLGSIVWDWGPEVTADQKQLIRAAIELGWKHAERICAEFGPYSLQCRRFREAVESFGQEGVKNGVIVVVGTPQTKGAAAETTPSCLTKTKCNPADSVIVVTITEETVKSEDLTHVIPHEGSHVADALKWWASGCKISSNPFIYDTESKAYYVFILSARAYKPHVPYPFLLRGGGLPGKNPFLPERMALYDPKMKPEDWQKNIDKLLAHPKSAHGLYEVTSKSPGERAFGPCGARN